jgi:hypothetical protein
MGSKIIHPLIWSLLGISLSTFAQARNDHALWHDGSKIVSPRECGSCHRKEFAVWEETGHARHSNVDDHYETAEYVKLRMGVLSMNNNSVCVKCHYTGVKVGVGAVGVAGVSCESCHGPAKDWLNLHNTVRPNEDAAQREARREMSLARGMIRPAELYQLASKCFECHMVSEEELVNRGGHNTGTRDFNLLAAMEEIRHNFLHARFAAGKVENTPFDIYRRRIIFVLGGIMDVEFSLRALASSTQEGRYRKAMTKRLSDACKKLEALCRTGYFPDIELLLEKIETIHPGQFKSKADEIADQFSVSAKRFAIAADARSLEGVDKLLLSQKPQKQ